MPGITQKQVIKRGRRLYESQEAVRTEASRTGRKLESQIFERKPSWLTF